ncbi:hypothetical protein R6Z07M_009444 [Ovis aries]
MAISANEIARIKHYELLGTTGEGHFAKVKLAWHVLTTGLVAIKVIQKTNQSLSSIKEQFREVDSLRIVNHPNPCKLVEVTETEETLFILVSALQHCHQRGVVHWDLKLGNLLLDANNNVKISDFGLSNQWHPGKKLDTFCGSPAFMAPELFLGMPYTDPELDVWSFGIILYTMDQAHLCTCGRRDSSHTCDTSLTHDAMDACHTISTCDNCGTRGTSLTRDASSTCDPASPVIPASPVRPAAPGTSLVPATQMAPVAPAITDWCNNTSLTRDTSIIHDFSDARDASEPMIAMIPAAPASPMMPVTPMTQGAPGTPATPVTPASPMTP